MARCDVCGSESVKAFSVRAADGRLAHYAMRALWFGPGLDPGDPTEWAIIMLIVPFAGLLLYTLVRPSDAQIAQRSRRR